MLTGMIEGVLVLDTDGREMSREEAIAKGHGHLLDDAIFLRCSKCRRKSTQARGELCNMPQTDGSICDGRFN